MDLTKTVDSITDQLETNASREKFRKISAAEEYYNGYMQACKDFRWQIIHNKEIVGQVSKKGNAHEI